MKWADWVFAMPSNCCEKGGPLREEILTRVEMIDSENVDAFAWEETGRGRTGRDS